MSSFDKPLMVLSVDVEALPARADTQHVEKLIWGRFDGFQAFGLREMMQEAEAVNASLTCFLDYAEKDIFGEQIDAVAREIVTSGHDLQLHLHPEILSDGFWNSRGMEKPSIAPNRWDEKTARIPFEHYIEEFSLVKGTRPDAFRAGSFRSNPGQIKAMGEFGIPISSNMAFSTYIKQGRKPLGRPDDVLYEHYNGVMEIPVTQVKTKNDDWMSLIFPWPPRAIQDMDQAFENLAKSGRQITVLLLHSWNLLKHPKGGKGYFAPGSEDNLLAFRSMMQSAAKYFDIVSFGDIAKSDRDGLLRLSQFKLTETESSLLTVENKESRQSQQAPNVIRASNIPGKYRHERTYGLVIGGMRCGSTASFKNISRHPEVCAADRKEVHFFSSDENWGKGYEWYRKQWSTFDPGKHKVCLESSTHYSKYPIHKDVPKRMSEIEQDVRIIYSVRDPIERAESHLAFQMGKGYLAAHDPQKRERFLSGIAIQYSSYFYQIEQYLRYFSKDKIHIVVQEEMKNHPESIYPAMFNFLGVDEDFQLNQEILNDRKKYIKPSVGTQDQDDSHLLTSSEKSALFKALEEDVDRFLSEFDIDPGSWGTYSGFK